MRKVKWIFFGYLVLCLLVLASVAVSFVVTRQRDPLTNYASYGGNIKTLDPAEIGDTTSGDIAGYACETLYNYQYGKEEPYALEPALAEGQPEVSADLKTLIIHVKHGVHYYDPEKAIWSDGVGPEVTAEDFIYSWKRVCDQKLYPSSTGNEANYGQVFQGHVEGIDDWHDYTRACKTPAEIDWSRPVSGLTALDRYTLRIKLIDPFPQLQFNLAMIPTAAVCRQIVDHYGDHFRNHLVGTGPYVVKQHLIEQQITFETNPIYRGGVNVETGTQLTDEQRLPHVKRVQLNLYAEDLPRWYMFLQGRLDANDIPKDTFGQAVQGTNGQLTQQMKDEGIKLVTSVAPEVRYVGFNMTDPVLGKNKPLRQAICMAYDRQTYIDVYLNGRGRIANGPIPPGFPTFDPKRVDKYSTFDLAAARQKLKEAEKINGGPIPRLHILFGDTETTTTQSGDYFVSQMKQIGLDVVAEYHPWARFLEMMDARQEQMFDLGWVADYPDEQDFWQLFYSKFAGPGGLNSCNYSNPEFDALYEKSAMMAKSPQRDELYAKMQAMVLEDCPWLFGYFPIDYTLYHDWESPGPTMAYGYGMKQNLKMDFNKRTQWLARH